eukprot:scaffold84121_cov105-Phaeocystis_antarctica.AAC.3
MQLVVLAMRKARPVDILAKARLIGLANVARTPGARRRVRRRGLRKCKCSRLQMCMDRLRGAIHRVACVALHGSPHNFPHARTQFKKQ